jgi:hypothetical protein
MCVGDALVFGAVFIAGGASAVSCHGPMDGALVLLFFAVATNTAPLLASAVITSRRSRERLPNRVSRAATGMDWIERDSAITEVRAARSAGRMRS